MSINYPQSIPSSPGFRSLVFKATSIVGKTRSVFTGTRQITQWSGSYWLVDAQLPIMETRAQAEEWISFLLACRGMAKTFLLGPESPARSPQGTVSGVTVSGGGQTGTSLTLAGTGSFVKGDYIQIGSTTTSRLYKLLESGSATGTFEIFPALRESPSNGATVTLTNPVGLFALADNQSEWTIDMARMYGISFTAEEAFAN